MYFWTETQAAKCHPKITCGNPSVRGASGHIYKGSSVLHKEFSNDLYPVLIAQFVSVSSHAKKYDVTFPIPGHYFLSPYDISGNINVELKSSHTVLKVEEFGSVQESWNVCEDIQRETGV